MTYSSIRTTPTIARLLAFQVAFTACLCVSHVRAEEPLAVQLEALLEQRDFRHAIEVGKQLDEQSDGNLDVTLSLARLARALQQAGQLDASR